MNFNQDETQDILNDITQCCYNPNTYNILLNSIKQINDYPAKKKPTKRKIKIINQNKIIGIKYSMQIPFNNTSYEVPILIYFLANFPIDPPHIILQVSKGNAINPNSINIDKNTKKINVPSLNSWNPNTNLTTVLNEIKSSFTKSFPIYKLKKHDNENDNKNSISNQFLNQNFYNIKNNCDPNTFNNANNNFNNMNNNMNNNINNNMNNNNQNQNDMNINAPYDELKSKAALVSLLVEDLSQKINLARKPIYQTFVKLDNIKVNIEKKLKDFTKIESKSNNIEQTINGLKQDMINTITSPTEPEKIDLSNLDTALIIKNKDYYLRLSKERAIEEYILLIKKSYEKQNMNFDTALNSIRINTRNLFFIKYKNLHPFGE